MRRRTEIILEVERTWISRGQGGPVFGWCGGCAKEAWMLKPEQAALITYQNTRTIYRRIEAGQVHYTEGRDGLLLVCLESVQDSQERQDRR